MYKSLDFQIQKFGWRQFWWVGQLFIGMGSCGGKGQFWWYMDRQFFFSVCGQIFVGREVLLDLVKFCWVWSSFVRYGQVHCTTNPKHFMDDFIPFQTTF